MYKRRFFSHNHQQDQDCGYHFVLTVSLFNSSVSSVLCSTSCSCSACSCFVVLNAVVVAVVVAAVVGVFFSHL